MFNRKRPCKTCPFRTGGQAVRGLHPARAEEIADTLLSDGSFTCHDDLDAPESKRNHCVGAMLILEKLEQPNQMMRIAERMGFYDRDQITGHDEVFDDFDEWMAVQEDMKGCGE
jgi:hypothetical protein